MRRGSARSRGCSACGAPARRDHERRSCVRSGLIGARRQEASRRPAPPDPPRRLRRAGTPTPDVPRTSARSCARVRRRRRGEPQGRCGPLASCSYLPILRVDRDASRAAAAAASAAWDRRPRVDDARWRGHAPATASRSTRPARTLSDLKRSGTSLPRPAGVPPCHRPDALIEPRARTPRGRAHPQRAGAAASWPCCRRHRLPAPEVDARGRRPSRWTSSGATARLAVETVGYRFHGDRASIRSRSRQGRGAGARSGLRVLRLTYRQVRRRSERPLQRRSAGMLGA